MQKKNHAQENQPATIDRASLHVLPTPPTIHLKTTDDVRLEMAKVYRDMRQGRIDMADGTKLAYVLGQLNKAIETGIIESRMETLERTLNAGKPLADRLRMYIESGRAAIETAPRRVDRQKTGSQPLL